MNKVDMKSGAAPPEEPLTSLDLKVDHLRIMMLIRSLIAISFPEIQTSLKAYATSALECHPSSTVACVSAILRRYREVCHYGNRPKTTREKSCAVAVMSTKARTIATSAMVSLGYRYFGSSIRTLIWSNDYDSTSVLDRYRKSRKPHFHGSVYEPRRCVDVMEIWLPCRRAVSQG